MTFVEDVGKLDTELARDLTAWADTGLIDLHAGRFGIGDVESNDGMAALLQRAGQIDALAHGDALDVSAGGHAAHAIDAEPGYVVALARDQRVPMGRLEVAERRQRLLQDKREAGQRAANGSDHATAPDGLERPASRTG